MAYVKALVPIPVLPQVCCDLLITPVVRHRWGNLHISWDWSFAQVFVIIFLVQLLHAKKISFKEPLGYNLHIKH